MSETMEGTIRQIADELLDAVAAISRAEVSKVQLIADLVDASSAVEPRSIIGPERLTAAGADGTPEVAEFLVVELAALLRMGTPSAWALIRDVMNLRHRHPRLWAALTREEVPVWQARKIAARCAGAGLSRDAATMVDRRLESAWGRLPWQRLLRTTEGLIVAADTELAARRAAERQAERFVAIHHDGDGSSTLLARMNTADAMMLKNAIDSIANAMVLDGRPEALPRLRSETLAELARPTERGTLPRPNATMVVHLPSEALGGESNAAAAVAREDSIGALLLQQVRELLGHHRVRLLPVLDLAGDPSVDAYEIPDRMRTQLTIREPFSVFPFSTVRSVNADLDHTVPYRANGPPGQTRPSNLGPLGRREHRAKTHGRWQLSQPAPGTYRWTSGLGYEYDVADGRSASADERRDTGNAPPDSAEQIPDHVLARWLVEFDELAEQDSLAAV